eukprot:g3411.t1
MKVSHIVWLIASIGLLLAAFFAQAQIRKEANSDRRLTPVTVTARKKEESALSAPLSVSAFTGEQLEAQGVVSFDQVLSTVPNAGQSGGIGGNLQGLISIRGISTLVRFVGLETGVGFYVDGVYTGRPENFNQDLIDIERIEVLRGPQGALFGKNTIAGAINIITKTPDEFEAQAELTVGNYDLFQARAGISGPIVEDTLFGSLTASYTDRDGYVENAGIGGDLDNADLTTYRGKLRWTPMAGSEFILAADALIDRGNPAFFEVTDVSFIDDPSEATPFTVNIDQPNFLDRDVWGTSLTANIDLGGGTWTTVAAYRDTSFDAGLDDDKVPARAVEWYGNDVTDPEAGTSTSADLDGMIAHGIAETLTDAELTFITIEFGTYDVNEVLTALRGDNWLYQKGSFATELADSIKRDIRRAFYPETDEWKLSVWQRAIEVVQKAQRGLVHV